MNAPKEPAAAVSLFDQAAASGGTADDAVGEPAEASAATHDAPAGEDTNEAAPEHADAAEALPADEMGAGAAATEVEAEEAPPSPAAEAAPAATQATPRTAILPDEDEPYLFRDCTVTVTMQLLPDDGHEDGREVILCVSSHIEGPLIEITRLNKVGPFSPLVNALLKQHEERLPTLGEERARQRELESSKASSSRSKTTVRPGASRTSTGARPGASSGKAGGAPSGEQTSLFSISTGRRPDSPAAKTA